ncbi:MAG: hypothetical protein OXK79_12165 [Chloroflexota bacterium]|nr:hypothetical protein [Chloroflexota bacterium]
MEQAWGAYEQAMAVLVQVGSDHNAALEQCMAAMRQSPYPSEAAMEASITAASYSVVDKLLFGARIG